MSMEWSCIVCNAKVGEPCRNTIDPKSPLPGRSEHHARVLAPTPKRKEKKR